jgi:hypothetical protein
VKTTEVRKLDSVAENLSELIQIHEDRAHLYGNDYLTGATSIMGLFPRGVEARTPRDAIRLGLIYQLHAKLLRYCYRFNDGGHEDSLDDIAVYAQMLKNVDEVMK